MSKKSKQRFLEKKQAQEQAEKKFRDTVVVTAKTPGQKKYVVEIKNNDIIICTGAAGTGKTVIAVGLGLQGLTAPQPAYQKMIIVRPVIEACGERIGFLPGDLQEKLIPWVAPIVDNMQVFLPSAQIKNLFHENRVEVLPLAYMRGRSLNRSFILVDEAQNCSVEQMLLILTRIGIGSKLVINGDLTQCDSKYHKNGLKDAIERLQGLDGVSILEMGNEKQDIVRHPLIADIISRYSPAQATVAPVTASLENMAKPNRIN